MRENALLFFLLLAFAPVLAQVIIPGNFSIGDSSQTHILHTLNGDRLVGRVAAWRGDSIFFLQNQRHKLGYPAEQISRIEVNDGTPYAEESELFILKSRMGKTYTGYLVSLDRTMVKFKSREDGIIRLKPDSVEVLYATPAVGGNWKNFANDYRLTKPDGEKTDGQVAGISDGKLHFLAEGGKLSTISLRSFRTVRYLKSHLPVFGYRRSSMFAPTGFNLRKKQLEYRNIGYFIHNSIGYGLSDKLSVTGGIYGLLPILGLKASHAFGRFVHLSGGAYAMAGIAFGAHGSVSVGTPDYYINVCLVRNTEFPFNSDLDFSAISYGAFIRTGRRSRVFGEYIFLNEKRDEFGGFSSTGSGRRNVFTWGISFFGKKTRLEAGMMLQGPAGFCFEEECGDIYRVLPVISGGALLTRKKY